MTVPDRVEVVVEVPRGGHVKRHARGHIEVLSPIGCPFNYGSVVGLRAADGDLHDVIVLGPALPRGGAGWWPVVGVVRFLDDGQVDDKLVCKGSPPTWWEIGRLRAFFGAYALAKGAVRLGRRRGPTRMLGWEPRP